MPWLPRQGGLELLEPWLGVGGWDRGQSAEKAGVGHGAGRHCSGDAGTAVALRVASGGLLLVGRGSMSMSEGCRRNGHQVQPKPCGWLTPSPVFPWDGEEPTVLTGPL
jgi:hypothetical protein